MKLSKAAQGFLMHKSAENRAETTLRDYRHHLNICAAYLDDPEVGEVTTGALRAFFVYLRKYYRPRRITGNQHSLSPKTLHNYWITLRSFYTWATVELGIEDALAPIHAPEFAVKVVDPLTQAECQAMMTACLWTMTAETTGAKARYRMRRPTGLRDQAILRLLLDTGVRAGECTHLNVGDVDVKTGQVTIHPRNSGRKSRSRHVQLGRSARKSVWKYLASREDGDDPKAPLFTTGKGFRLQRDSLRHLVRRLGKRAGVQGRVYPHRFRHTFAITYLRFDGDIYTLQRMLGHTSLEMVRRYLAIVRDDVVSAHKRASPVDNWRI